MLALDPDPAAIYVRVHTLDFSSMPPARHRAYAFQWFTFALAAVVILLVLHRKQRPKPTSPPAMNMKPADLRKLRKSRLKLLLIGGVCRADPGGDGVDSLVGWQPGGQGQRPADPAAAQFRGGAAAVDSWPMARTRRGATASRA